MFNTVIIGVGAVLVIAILITMYVLGLRRIVPTNEVHIVQRNDKTVAYGKDTGNGNIYYQIPAWVPRFGVVVSKLPSTIFDVTLDKYEAYDKDRLPFVVDVKAFFRIADFAVAASRIFTINELVEKLTAIVQGEVRAILAKEKLEDIMSKRSEYGEIFSKDVAPQLQHWGVVAVKNIELMDIRDSHDEQVIENIMMKKKSAIEMERRVEVAKNLQTAQEAEIMAKQEIEIKQQEAVQQVGLRKAEVEKEVGIANQKQQQEVQTQAKVTAEKEMEVKKVREVQAAEIEKQAATVKANQDKEVTKVNAEASVIKAEADQKVVIVSAEATKTQVELKAEADLTAATNEAKGMEAKGSATAKARDLLEKAQVAGQIELFNKVNKDKEYQNFLVKQRQVEAMEKIGVEQAKNLSGADIKIFANAGSVADGVTQAGRVLNPKTGLDLGSMLESFASTPVGGEITKKVIDKLSKKGDEE